MNRRPFFTLCNYILTPLFSYLGLPGTLRPFVSGFWSVLSTIIGAMGIFPTLRLLWAFRGVLRGQAPLESLALHGPDVERLFIRYIRPFWTDLIVSRTGATNFIYLVISTTIFYAIKPITMFFIRLLFSLFITSLGIFWSETLRGFKYLFEYASFVKDFFSAIFHFDLPIPKELETTFLQKVGLFCLGIFAIGFTLIGLDLYFQDLFTNFPVLNSIVDWCYYIFTPAAYLFRKIVNFINIFRGGGRGGNGHGPQGFFWETWETWNNRR